MNSFKEQGDIPTVQYRVTKKYRIRLSAASVIGTRKKQQDCVFAQTEENGAIAVICDGIGGLENGEIASQIAVKTLVEDFYERELIDSIQGFLEQEIIKIDRLIADYANCDQKRIHMGTTLVTVIIDGNECYWASVGDSRIYFLRNHDLYLMNQMHNYRFNLNKQLKTGMITKEEYHKEEKNAEALISYLGMGNISLMDIGKKPIKLMEGDEILLCSDGLYKRYNDNEIRGFMENHNIPFKWKAGAITGSIMKQLRGSQDNTSVALMKYTEF